MAVVTHNTTARAELDKVTFAEPQNQAGPSRKSRPRPSTDSSLTLSAKSDREPSPIMETQFQSQGEDSDDQLWEADCILDERGEVGTGQYLVKWVGNDPATGEGWEPTWERRDGVTPALAKEWKAKKKREPNCIGIEGKKLEAAQRAKMEAARRKKREERLAKSKKKGKGKSTPRISEVIDITKSRSPTLDTPDAAARKTKRSSKGGPTERDTPVRSAKEAKAEAPNSTSSTKGVPLVVLPRRSMTSLATMEVASNTEAYTEDTTAMDVEPAGSSSARPALDITNQADHENDAQSGGIDDEGSVVPDHQVDHTSPVQTHKRAAPASSPPADQATGFRQKRVRIDPVASSMKPSEAGPSKPKSAPKQSNAITEPVDSDISTGKDALGSKSLGPVPVPSAFQFRSLLAGNDSTQSTASTGPGLSQLDPIQQFSSPARDSLNQSKHVKSAMEPSAKAVNVAKAKVQKKMVNGEEVLGVESDSEDEMDESQSESGPEMPPTVPVIDAEITEEVNPIAAVDTVSELLETATSASTVSDVPALISRDEAPPAGLSRLSVEQPKDTGVPSTSQTSPAHASSSNLKKTPTATDRLDAAGALTKVPSTSQASSPVPASGSNKNGESKQKAVEVPSTAQLSSPAPAAASSTNGQSKTPTAMDRLDAVAARKGTAGPSRIPMPAPKTPRPIIATPIQPKSAHAQGADSSTPKALSASQSDDWTLRMTPAVRLTNDEQRVELAALRKLVAQLQVEKIGGWKGPSSSTTAAASTSANASININPPASREAGSDAAGTKKFVKSSATADTSAQTDQIPVVAAVTTDTIMQTDPLPVVPAVVTADMGLQTDPVPAAPPIVTIDMALQTEPIPAPTPAAVVDMASQTIPISIPVPPSVTNMASQTDSIPEPPTFDQKAFDEQLAAKDADRKKWRTRAKRAEAELETLQADLQFIRDRYNEASESAVAAVAKSNELESKVTILQDQLKHGLKQRELHNSAVKGRQDKQMALLVAQNKILLEQSRRTDDSVRAKAAAYPELEANYARLEQLLRDAMRKIDVMTDRNDELVSQIEILRATQMGVLNANEVDDSEDEDFSYDSDSESSVAPSPSPPPVRSSSSRTKRSSAGTNAIKAESPIRTITIPIAEHSQTASQLMPDTQDLISAVNSTSLSLDYSDASGSIPRPEERNGGASRNPWNRGIFHANESSKNT